MPILNKSERAEIPAIPQDIDSEHERLSTKGINLSSEERALLHDPAWIDKEEADAIMAMKIEKAEADSAIPIEQDLRERGLDRTLLKPRKPRTRK